MELFDLVQGLDTFIIIILFFIITFLMSMQNIKWNLSEQGRCKVGGCTDKAHLYLPRLQI